MMAGVNVCCGNVLASCGEEGGEVKCGLYQ